ncbi:5-methyltetrahydropteroyltriglutamate--homocysteine S-methyltransferase [Myxococcus sp. K15C18031901]|uniref:5-methyltetrahydropteroyltriglutamate-- homocysteine S-methyltransferase n=1 Tax=Myxococcus dinghuensis TaxID=2906761 RepID=UPI0020A8219D|nr:5-methyltetrahydropteroyltriglutamate--homocysteine S-methyltransferase [Myxococcus dinghuensis]MCP3099434.1 5-methyltetrahydropteroyltriglutamate--homocysteine S-methyltransferase [Myxococcus dinghuensis]
MTTPATSLGHPRFGGHRELKKALESYWGGKSAAGDLLTTAADLRRRHWTTMKAKGLTHVPCNDFSLYDHVLDMAVCLGVVPERYQSLRDPLERYFAMARGHQDGQRGLDLAALEMTKWFDTNYHYIVPELEVGQRFALDATKLLAELEEARNLQLEPRPVLLGPLSFLLLSKHAPHAPKDASTLALLDAVLPVYEQLLAVLAARDVSWVQLDEPCLVLDLSPGARAAYEQGLRRLSQLRQRPRLLLATYFGELGANLSLATGSGFEALHVDLVRAPSQLDAVLRSLPATMGLSVGVVDGRNVWRTDLDAAHQLVRRAVRKLGADRVLVAPSCSLLHVPEDLDNERKLDPEVKSWLSFANQKLDEVRALANASEEDAPTAEDFTRARAAIAVRRASPRTRNATVRTRMRTVDASMSRRAAPFHERARRHHERLRLPVLPTTTIGSFPQTSDVRGARAAWRAGHMSAAEYDTFLKEETRRCIQKQEAIGLDVLVHGEFERNDMVEYFGEQLDGFVFTENGWVQSYGSRCVKPPLLYGDVARPRSMTVAWSTYAQSLTPLPVKGMLTGPVTILQWSFVRDDQPRGETCQQIALALRDEVQDLEAAGISIIQVDEPAIREGLPLRRQDWKEYLRWAVDAFKVATSGVRDETQIHTHMCYSEFGEILDDIARMDADVLSIETSRSKLELLVDFAHFKYPNEIGPGVYDIHSPRVPSREEMVDLLEKARSVLPASQLWVNPDCGLKTRGWPEVEAALTHMVAAAKVMRERLEGASRPRSE